MHTQEATANAAGQKLNCAKNLSSLLDEITVIFIMNKHPKEMTSDELLVKLNKDNVNTRQTSMLQVHDTLEIS